MRSILFIAVAAVIPLLYVIQKKKNRKKSKFVFLGGSCNPTKWRKEISIPILEERNIQYYNPQVEEWSPELIEIEEKKKEEAALNLFVIDSQTRGIASMLEVVELLVRGDKIILVINNIDKNAENCLIEGEEIKDLNRGRAYLRSMACKYNVKVYDDIASATLSACNYLKSV